MRSTLHSLFKQTAEAVLPPLQHSRFNEKGVCTPDEFVRAGDYLVHACPTWSWEGGDKKKARQFLPSDKQYLVTRNVPCMRRAKDLEQAYDPNSEFAVSGEEDWVATHRDPEAGPLAGAEAEDIPCIDGAEEGGKKKGAEDEEEDIPDINELELRAEEDEAALPPATATTSAPGSQQQQPLGAGYRRVEEPEETILKTRTYDLYITYDQYYQVPRFWLVGYDESRHPLAPDQVLDDVSEEHARKTITVEAHPHLALTAASIHPCRHGETMKRLVDNITEGGGTFAVEHYLLLFLKFIASVVPTIQYDYTMSVGQ